MSMDGSAFFDAVCRMLVVFTFGSTVVLALGGLATLLMIRASAAARHFVHLCGMVGVVGVFVVNLLPSWPVPAWAAAAVRPMTGTLERAANAVTFTLEGEVDASVAVQPLRSAPVTVRTRDGTDAGTVADSRVRWSGILVLLWVAGVGGCALRRLAGLRRLRRCFARSRPVANTEWQAALATQARLLGVGSRVRLHVTEAPVMPMTWGWLRHTVLLPADGEAWPSERLELVLRHELAHVKRFDCLTQSLCDFALTLQWFHPLAWYAARRMRAERERACDDLVLATGARSSAYADHLLQIALQYRDSSIAAALPMAPPCGLRRRLEAILSESGNRGGLRLPFAVLLAAAALAIVAALHTDATPSSATTPVDEPAPDYPHLREFFAGRERLARALEAVEEARRDAGVGREELPPIVWDYFAAGKGGDWETMAALYAQLLDRNPAYGGMSEGKHVSLAGPVWACIEEGFGAYDVLRQVGGEYAGAFTRDVLHVMPEGSIYFGGTETGRYLITAEVATQATEAQRIVLTQNRLADGNYLEYLRYLHADAVTLPGEQDSRQVWKEFIGDMQHRMTLGQLEEGEGVRIQEDGSGSISGASAVMKLSGSIARWILDHNPDRTFFVEESRPLEWMYPHLSPEGPIMKLHREPLPGLDESTMGRDRAYWERIVHGAIGNGLRMDAPIGELCGFAARVYGDGNLAGVRGDPAFFRHAWAGEPYARARSAIAGLYHWRAGHAEDPAERARHAAAADHAYRQAFVLCPRSADVASRFVAYLADTGRSDDAKLVAATAMALNPDGQFSNAFDELAPDSDAD
jgi:beta-lactamase regulating signal transducer with metallopeptidase domain